MNNEVASAKKIIVATKPHSPVSEQFRTIRTNIMYSSIDRPIRSVLFTSAVAGTETISNQ